MSYCDSDIQHYIIQCDVPCGEISLIHIKSKFCCANCHSWACPLTRGLTVLASEWEVSNLWRDWHENLAQVFMFLTRLILINLLSPWLFLSLRPDLRLAVLDLRGIASHSFLIRISVKHEVPEEENLKLWWYSRVSSYAIFRWNFKFSSNVTTECQCIFFLFFFFIGLNDIFVSDRGPYI